MFFACKNLKTTKLHHLREERLKLVIIADLAYQPDRRGNAFPHSSVDNKAKVCYVS